MKKSIRKILSIIALVIIFMFIIGIVYSIFTGNGRFALAMMSALLLVSIVLYVAFHHHSWINSIKELFDKK